MNKTLIVGGIVAVAIVVSMAYGAQMNPGGNEEKFILQRNLVDTDISKYYTWEYLGQKFVQFPETEGEANYEITIQRGGNLEGSVSISLTKIDRSI